MNPPSPVALRDETDLLALIPYTLGFVPEDSLVLVAFGDGARPSHARPFHARVDLPDDPGVLDEVGDHLAAAAVRSSAAVAFVVVYTHDECLAQIAASVLSDRLARAEVRVLSSLRADGNRWYPLDADDIMGSEGVPYDITTHPLTSRGVLEGQVTYGSRDELRDSLGVVDPDLAEEVDKAMAGLPALPPDRAVLLAEVVWLREWVDVLLHGGADAVGLCAADDLARLLRALAHPDIRDQVWCDMSRETAPAHVALWREVVRRSPHSAVAPAAALLGFCAWLSGNGALGWCAVDRALEADPDQSLARLVGDVLTAAMPPWRWRPVPAESLPLYAG